MTQRMLIDARHPEETRVAVLSGNRIEEFDFESAERKQLKGNIYLAKVTRVEPSLQAAFIEFGGNRHGFLAFSEIHPDYYQIPKEDREALLAEEAEEARLVAQDEDDDAEDGDDEDGEDHDHGHDIDAPSIERPDGGPEALDAAGDEAQEDGDAPTAPRSKSAGGSGDGDHVEALRRRRQNLRRRYKIQDVIHRRQVLLVQVVKEERGNKGAALTTYLSLAGRYCVLMPNTSSGGGISRKISNASDRKRLKSIMSDLQLPRTMGCIVRTAGLSRTKTEIKRDFDYLARLWDEIRERTLASAAPVCIHEDSSLIKRAIRDIYHREIDEVIVEGEAGYHAARQFMKLLMPSHARKIAPYADVVPLFQRFGAEDQLSAMYQPVVQLKSGGYLVINPTEALVSIDINSGRSTREHNIEQTATATNLEAAHEIARQLRLRDMAGLVVIDFIDMENGSNVRKVERAMKDALRNDRARIQVGRISSFGLMEMSRQRLRTGVLEASTRVCPHCEGSGFVRTASSAGLSALRLIEDAAARGRGSQISLRTSREAAIYVLNRKRNEIAEIEDRYGVEVAVLPDGHDEGARMAVDVSGPPPAHAPKAPPPILIEQDEFDLIEDEEDDEEVVASEPSDEDGERGERAGPDEGDRQGARRKRRRRRRGRREDGELQAGEEPGEAEDGERGPPEIEPETVEAEAVAGAADDHDAAREGGRRRRRGRRGGRRREGAEAGTEGGETGPEPFVVDAGDVGTTALDHEPAGEPLAATAAVAAEPAAAPKPTARRRPRARTDLPQATAPEADGVASGPGSGPEEDGTEPAPEASPTPRRGRRKTADVAEVPAAAAASATEDEAAPKPKRGRRKAAGSGDVDERAPAPVAPIAETPISEEAPLAPAPAPAPAAAVPEPQVEAETEADDGSTPRRGWWQRTFGA